MTAEQTETHDVGRVLHAKLSNLLSRLYPMVPREDISQELWAAYLENRKVLDEAEGDDPDAAERSLRRRMRGAAERFCRKEKAAQAGYEPHDEAFYSTRALGELCKSWFASGVTESPPRTYETSVSRASGDASRGGDWLVSLIDVGDALRRLNENQREILCYAYSSEYAGMTDEEIASLLASRGWKGLTEAKFRGKVRWALNRLQRELGGQNPWATR